MCACTAKPTFKPSTSRQLKLMRAVVQRVIKASVSVDGEVISSIGRGLCVLIGVCKDDTLKDIEWMVQKILKLRVFEDSSEKRWSKSVTDYDYEILCVSQFTLYCTLKGNKPDYHLAMAADQSELFYNDFLKQLRSAYKPELVKDGKFGAYMKVNIENDGPVTIQLEAPAQLNQSKKKGSSASLVSDNEKSTNVSSKKVDDTKLDTET